MQTIWKFPLALLDDQIVQMPANAHHLAAQMQGEELCLWAIVNPDATTEPRRVRVVGTGRPTGDLAGFDHVGTVQDGSFVWHIFLGWPATEGKP